MSFGVNSIPFKETIPNELSGIFFHSSTPRCFQNRLLFSDGFLMLVIFKSTGVRNFISGYAVILYNGNEEV